MCKFRDLHANEIDVRVGQCTDKKVTLLLYKDARVDMNLLDETVGSLNWQREHYEVKGNMYCRVGINRNYKSSEQPVEWVWKADCGVESNTEGEKGEASDSFKRACINLGIGRELYTAPVITVWSDKVDIKPFTVKGETRYRTYDQFAVKSIKIENKIITALEIFNVTKQMTVFSFGRSGRIERPSAKMQPTPSAPPSPTVFANQVPFPEAIPRTEAPKNAQGAPKPFQPDNSTDIAAEREWAVKFTVTEGNRAGMPLGDIYKMDKAEWRRLKDAPPSIEIAKAITIIEEWIASK